MYDSTEDTMKHKNRVKELLLEFISDERYLGTELMTDIFKDMAENHDDSKLEEPEKETFDKYTPKLKNSTYGGEEYNSFLKGMDKALKHHYENNSHHPEHYENGISDMDMFDVVEMFFDWKCATERHDDGNILESIKINKERFGYDIEFEEMYIYSAISLGYVDDKEYQGHSYYDIFDLVEDCAWMFNNDTTYEKVLTDIDLVSEDLVDQIITNTVENLND